MSVGGYLFVVYPSIDLIIYMDLLQHQGTVSSPILVLFLPFHGLPKICL